MLSKNFKKRLKKLSEGMDYKHAIVSSKSAPERQVTLRVSRRHKELANFFSNCTLGDLSARVNRAINLNDSFHVVVEEDKVTFKFPDYNCACDLTGDKIL